MTGQFYGRVLQESKNTGTAGTLMERYTGLNSGRWGTGLRAAQDLISPWFGSPLPRNGLARRPVICTLTCSPST